MDKNNKFNKSFAEIMNDILTVQQELNPSILKETKVEVFNGFNKQEFTILTLDAGSMLKLSNRSMGVDGKIDMFQHAKNLLQFRVKEIEDAEEFLKNNTLDYVDRIAQSINDVDKGKVNNLKIIK